MEAVGLWLLGAGRGLVAWLSRRSLAELACLALALFAMVEHLQLTSARSEAHRWHERYNVEHTGRLQDRASYEQAQKDAAAKNKAQVQQVEQQQQRITDDVEARYRADLARLRVQSNTPAKGAPGQSGSPETGPTTGGPHSEEVPLPASELLRAQETELQLNALIDWTLQQSKVDPNKQVPRGE